MLFTRDGLEMASHETVARLHATILEGSRALDLTCGIGADLIAFSRNQTSIGFDTNAEHVEYANHNLKVHGVRGRAINVDCTTVHPNSKKDVVFADPQRRSAGRRTLDPSEFQPNLGSILKQVERCRAGLIKLSPMLKDEFLDTLGGSVWFVSHQNQCCEALVFCNELSERGGGGAILAESQEFLESLPLYHSISDPLTYVFEANPAAIRGHCLGQFDLPGLGDSNGYLTSNNEISSPWLRQFEVIWHGHWRVDKVKEALEEANAKVTAVKCRGVDVDVIKVAKQVRTEGKRTSVLILYPIGKSIRAMVATESK